MPFDPAAPIVPGHSAAGIRLGPVADVEPQTLGLLAEHPAARRRLDAGPVRLWVTNGAITQIGVRAGYRGCVHGTAIGVGSTIEDVEAAIGPVVEDEADNLVVIDSLGWCFETEIWQGHELSANRQARIIEIFVFPLLPPDQPRRDA